ncbi:MAG: DUF2840 domain-containing protein [Pseudomonadota bacterium]
MSKTEPLTSVIIAYRKNRFNHRLIFGEPALEIRRGWRRKITAFMPGAIFGYERWRADQYGTQDWRLFVCLTGENGPVSVLPGIYPGADCLFFVRGKHRVKRAFAAFDALKQDRIKLERIRAEEWRLLHNAFETGRSAEEETLIWIKGRPCLQD